MFRNYLDHWDKNLKLGGPSLDGACSELRISCRVIHRTWIRFKFCGSTEEPSPTLELQIWNNPLNCVGFCAWICGSAVAFVLQFFSAFHSTIKWCCRIGYFVLVDMGV